LTTTRFKVGGLGQGDRYQGRASIHINKKKKDKMGQKQNYDSGCGALERGGRFDGTLDAITHEKGGIQVGRASQSRTVFELSHRNGPSLHQMSAGDVRGNRPWEGPGTRGVGENKRCNETPKTKTEIHRHCETSPGPVSGENRKGLILTTPRFKSWE